MYHRMIKKAIDENRFTYKGFKEEKKNDGKFVEAETTSPSRIYKLEAIESEYLWDLSQGSI